jgi:hypothetical protein
VSELGSPGIYVADVANLANYPCIPINCLDLAGVVDSISLSSLILPWRCVDVHQILAKKQGGWNNVIGSSSSIWSKK